MTPHRADRRVDAGALRDRIAEMTGTRASDVRVVRAPYRFCPLGAHVDHQGGPVTGVALDRALHLAYVASDDPRVRLHSDDLAGTVEFSVDAVPGPVPGDWGNYPRGAARALGTSGGLTRGLRGLVAGEMSPGGVSTSAALGVACLLALEDVNHRVVSPIDNVELDRRIENEYLGLANGILDQSIILRAVREHLVHLDCRTGALEVVSSPAARDVAFLAVYSGVTATLTGTDYNRRVDECRSAAAALLAAVTGDARREAVDTRDPSESPDESEALVLRDVPRAVFDAHASSLPERLRKRAAHYFGEVARVHDGVDAWRRGDLIEFARLVTETGHSSVTNYECGSPELTDLFGLLERTEGVLGARFSGAGFRGYAMALVHPDDAERIGEHVASTFACRHPALASRVHWMSCRSADAAAILVDDGASHSA